MHHEDILRIVFADHESPCPILLDTINENQRQWRHGCQAYTVDREPQKQIGEIVSE